MSILNTLHRVRSLVQASLFHKLNPVRSITYSLVRFSENLEENTAENTSTVVNTAPETKHTRISIETSIKYMTSDAYKQTYGDNLVWKLYRRNHKGAIPPKKTRKTCIRAGQVCGNPCPICRDEYLRLDYRNVKLLEQFINSYNGDILSYMKTGICQKKYKELLVAITKAKDYGTIIFDVPVRQYDYSEWQTTKN
ncbi:28S ribosomal protein S18b, mitochondrial [Odontomachus brunneus]|uniref:28S ribosomal protein S18b, mitochondrial n=1 Tax=Odontomachus brunneus TaxID=486640 RepID=UPI0013F2B0F6|nr:28S ribosomal protein S18b, mitochondrial [Odontomachus brunneus]XP_032677497.1 28S ribosomal protein S18b, mitochondrial [Odontomachus brunneus]XP_032677498.1 28S ribosomal protein S18b, mitochondrial [Odontomachus brunneus]